MAYASISRIRDCLGAILRADIHHRRRVGIVTTPARQTGAIGIARADEIHQIVAGDSPYPPIGLRRRGPIFYRDRIEEIGDFAGMIRCWRSAVAGS